MSAEKLDDLDALIIRNLGDLDAASCHLMHKIQPRVEKAIDKFAENWASKHKWKGEFDFSEEGVWIAPPDWQTEEKDWLGTFWLDVGPNDSWDDKPGEDSFWLTRLCQKGRGVLGFRWYREGGIPTTEAKWKKFVRESGNTDTPTGKKGFVYEIGAKGFACEDSGLFFTDFKIDADKLITAMQDDDFETALEPMQDALDRLAKAKPEFDKMFVPAKKMFR
jgi:hypothetical protein